jgi:hypothetical protein
MKELLRAYRSHYHTRTFTGYAMSAQPAELSKMVPGDGRRKALQRLASSVSISPFQNVKVFGMDRCPANGGLEIWLVEA